MTYIDHSYSQLPDDEHAELLERHKREAAIEAEKERKRWEKAKSFRFIGGML